MDDLQTYWNRSSATVPDDKDPSAYAIEKEKLFPRNALVCDLGGGSGSDSLYFASHGHKVRLIDISDNALQRAKHAAAMQHLSQRVETFQCNMDEGKIPLPDACVNVVYSRLALHYFEPDNTIRLFAEVNRILKPSGAAYLTLKSPDDAAEMAYLNRTASLKNEGVFDEEGHIKTRYTVEQLTSMMRAAGVKEHEFQIAAYTEDLDNRKDRVKSGNLQLLLNEIQIHKLDL